MTTPAANAPNLTPEALTRDDRGSLTTRLAAASIGMITMAYLLYYAHLGLWMEVVSNLPLAFSAGLSWYFALRRHLRVARHTIILACNIAVFIGKARLGATVDLENYYWTGAVLGILFFAPRYPLDAVVALVQPLAFMYLGDHLPVGVDIASARVPSDILSHIDKLTRSAPLVALGIALVVHVVGERTYQARLEEAKRRIEGEHARVRLLRDIAVIANEAQELMSALQRAASLLATALGGDDWSVELPAALPRPTPRHVSFETRGGRGRLLVPIVAGTPEQVVAALVVTGPGLEPPDADRRADLASISRQLSLAAERLHAQEELARTHVKMITSAKMAALGVMAGGIAHEINNPLAVLQGYAARIRRSLGEPDGPRRIEDAIAHINDTIGRMSRIVAGLRTFARDSEADPMELVAVSGIIADTLALSSERFRSRGVSLDVAAVDPSLRCECRATQICQVLINLLNNAFDAVEGAPPRPEGKRIRVRAEVDGGSVRIEVGDNGPGIPEAIRERLFEPFFTTKPVGRGTGLGLSISKAIVESHGGTLSAEAGDWGSVFVVRLPRQ